jgi:hypothetical protein
MRHFCLLKDPAKYIADDWDLLADAASREQWLVHFEKQFADTLQCAAEQYGRISQKRTQAAGPSSTN